MMTNRLKLWLGASALALLSGALPAAPILSPMAADLAGVSLAGDAWAQESGEESGEGEGGTATECTTETGEGEEGGATECPEPTGEEGEGEGG
jgi:hypothetical protein